MTRVITKIPAYILNMVPSPVGKNETIKDGNEDVMKDTMPMLIEKCKRTLYHTKKLASFLKSPSHEKTLRNDADLILKHIKYVKDDEGFEQVRSPRRLLHEGKGDCDCFVVTLSSLLTNQKIPHMLRVIKQGDNAWTHIYIIVPKPGKKDMNVRSNYTVLDCVTNKFDFEPDFTSKKDFNMALQYLDGINEQGSLSTLGADQSEYCKRKNAEEINTVRYVDTMEILEKGLIPSKEFLSDNNIPYQVNTSDKGIESYVVPTPAGVINVPTIITEAEAAAIVASQQSQPVSENKQAAVSLPEIPKEVKTLGWLALIVTGVTLLWPSTPKPVMPAPTLSGAKNKQARTINKKKVQTITI